MGENTGLYRPLTLLVLADGFSTGALSRRLRGRLPLYALLLAAARRVRPRHPLLRHRLHGDFKSLLLGRTPLKPLAALLPGFCVLALAAITVHRNTLFRDPAGLWEAAVRVDPGNARAWYFLTKVHWDAGRFTEAERSLRATIAADPAFSIPIDGVLDLHAFRPREVRILVPEYLAACRERDILAVRIIHGSDPHSLTVKRILVAGCSLRRSPSCQDSMMCRCCSREV